MALKLDIINQALEDLGIASYEFDLQPDEQVSCLNRLNRMMAEWDSQGIRVSYNLSSTDSSIDDSGVHDWAVSPLASNLALRIAPMFGKSVPPEVIKMAEDGFNRLLVTTYNPPPMRYPNSMPRGQGWKYQRWTNRFYPEQEPGIVIQNNGPLDI